MNEVKELPAIAYPKSMPDTTRVWIYQADRNLSTDESDAISKELTEFIGQWKAHNQQLEAAAALYLNRFVCIFADERKVAATGCSIDSSMHFIKSLEKKYHLVLTDRMQMAYLADSRLNSIALQQLPEALNEGTITGQSLVFNNLIANLGQMKQEWIVPFGESWFKRFA